MNPILERFARIDTVNLSADFSFQLIQDGGYIYFQTSPHVEPEQTSILYKKLPLARFAYIIIAGVLSYEFYTSPFYNVFSWFPRSLSWVLIAGVTWCGWKLLERCERQMQERQRVPDRLFAVDIYRQKLVVEMFGTDSKSPHKKIDIDEVDAFYTWHHGGSDSDFNSIYAFT